MSKKYLQQIVAITEILLSVPVAARAKLLAEVVKQPCFVDTLSDFQSAKLKTVVCFNISCSLQEVARYHHKSGQFRGILAACVSKEAKIDQFATLFNIDWRSVKSAVELQDSIQSDIKTNCHPRPYVSKAVYKVTRIQPKLKTSIVTWINEHTIETADVKNTLQVKEQGVWIKRPKHYRSKPISAMFSECSVSSKKFVDLTMLTDFSFHSKIILPSLPVHFIP